MNSNLLTSYYFLAVLAENDSDIYDSVYVPLCKRSLYRISFEKKEGTHLDVQKRLFEDYGLNVPEEIVRQLLVRISRKLSSREKKQYSFNLMENGRCFQFADFSYDKIEDTYNSIRRGANALENAFQEFAKAQGSESEIPFQSFIDANKQVLSSYFTGKSKDSVIDDKYFLHAKFLQKIEQSHHDLYKAAEKAYLGSIIAAYLESGIDVGAKQESGVVYYLDTRVIFEILDLQAPESTQPARDMLALIKSTGGKSRVFSITIGEMTDILKKELSVFNSDHPTTSIGEACKRRGMNKLALISLQGKLASELNKNYGIEMDPISDSMLQRYRGSSDVERLVDTGYSPSNARHDVAAYLCVRERRVGQSLFQKQTHWFVTANDKLCAFNEKHKTGLFPEIILSSELTSILFLRHPKQFASAVSKNGLSALIAQTLIDEYADPDLINKFDRVMREKVDVTDEEYDLLLNYLASESTQRIEQLIDDVNKNEPEVANQCVHDIVNRIRTEKESEAQAFRDIEDEKESAIRERTKQEAINSELESSLASSELQLKESLDKLSKQEAEIEQLNKRNRRWIYVVVGIALVFIGYLLISFFSFKECIKSIIKWVIGAGGFWAFSNFVLNVYKTLKK